MATLGGTGFETGKVAIVSTPIEMPLPRERLIFHKGKSGNTPLGNLGKARAVGFCEQKRRVAADGRF
jgi:hypothetical protein